MTPRNSLENDTALYNLKLSAKDCIHSPFLSLSFLFLLAKQPDGSLLPWLAVSSSVCVYSLQCTPWLAVVQGESVVWLVEGGPEEYEPGAGTVVRLLHYFLYLYYKPGQGDPCIRLFYKLLGLASTPTYILNKNSMLHCLFSHQHCLCLCLSAIRLSVTSVMFKWMF